MLDADHLTCATRPNFGTGPAYHRVPETNMKGPRTRETQDSKGLSLRESWGEDLAKEVLLRSVFNPRSTVEELIMIDLQEVKLRLGTSKS